MLNIRRLQNEVKGSFSDDSDHEVEFELDGEEQFQSVLKTSQLPDKAKQQISFVGAELGNWTIEIPPQWEGKAEQRIRDCFLDAAQLLNIDIRLIVTKFRPDDLQIADMPTSVLDSFLGKLCRERMPKDLPIAYAWPSIVAAASLLVPNMHSVRTNLYVALVGNQGTGKTESRKHAFGILGIKLDLTIDAMVGSAEGLFKEGVDVGGTPKMFTPDELSHTLAKSAIDRASFPYVLNRAYDENTFQLVIAKQKQLPFNCRLSLIGGIVEDKFEESFNHATTGGLHDRFIFGHCPTNAKYRYRPFKGKPAEFGDRSKVTIDPDVWEMVDRWKDIDNLDNRAVQNALRVATICASFDGRETLRAKDLQPTFAFAQYQTKIKQLLAPNEGANLDAQCRVSILQRLKLARGGDGWVNRRHVMRSINANRYGTMFYRVLSIMTFNHEIEQKDVQKDGGGTRSFFLRIPRNDD